MIFNTELFSHVLNKIFILHNNMYNDPTHSSQKSKKTIYLRAPFYYKELKTTTRRNTLKLNIERNISPKPFFKTVAIPISSNSQNCHNSVSSQTLTFLPP